MDVQNAPEELGSHLGVSSFMLQF